MKKNTLGKWYRFFNKWTWFGIILVLISIILSIISEHILVVIFHELLQTIGIALIVGAVFDFSKNTHEFTDYISSLLSDIVVSKSFLKRLSSTDKEEALNLILQPSEYQIEQYSNINEYFKKQISRSIQMFDTNFKSNLVMNIDVLKENGVVVSKGKISYRIYKVRNKFEPIKVTFEREDSEVKGRRIIYPAGIVEITDEKCDVKTKTEAGINYKQYVFEIPDQLNDYPYLTIESDIYEKGFDHWTNFHWTSLTPYDGFTFTLKCQDNLVIHEYVVFDEKDPYYVKMPEDRKSITILSTAWLNAHTGFSLTVGEQTKPSDPASDSQSAEDPTGTASS